MTADTPSRLVPTLRFPEFLNEPGWARMSLRTALEAHGLKSDRTSEVHSVSLAKGILPQIEHMGRSYAASDTTRYSLVRPFDIVYTRSPLALFKLGIVKQHKGTRNAIVSPLYGVFAPKNRHLGQLIEAYFDSPSRSFQFLDPLAQKGAKNTIQLSNDGFLSGSLFLPKDEDEQQKIADCLGSLDDLIAAEGRKLEALRQHKQGLMQQLFPQLGETLPRLRFPEFQRHPEWDHAIVGDLVDTVNPPMKLTTSNYLADGRFPIIDQSQSAICGWTNDEQAVITRPLPVIVFGDHTCALKLVDRPFAQGADGIKILSAGHRITTSFLYQHLNCRPVMTAGYKRHFSDLKEKEVTFPSVDSGEQQKIADCLSVLDDQVGVQARKLDALKQHKQGLLQQLFPSLEEES